MEKGDCIMIVNLEKCDRKNIDDFLQKMKAGLSESKDAENQKEFLEKKEREFQNRLRHCNIMKRFQNANFEELDKAGVPADMEENYLKAKQYAENFKSYYAKGIGIMMMGSVGRMKTTLAISIAQYIMRHGWSAYFVPMAELLDTMIGMSRNPDRSELQRFEEMIGTTDLLILDDLGTEYQTNWVTNKVDAIISRRYNRMLPVIITTNLLPENLKDQYAKRFYDRLKGTSILMVSGGDSLRKAPMTE